MPAQHIRISGMPLGSRLLWSVAWNRRAVYIVAVIFGTLSAINLDSPYGLLAGIIPLITLYKAVAFVNKTAPELISAAKEMSLRAGSQRVGVPLESATTFSLARPEGLSPLGITAARAYTFVCVYITEDYFATFSGSKLSLPEQRLEPAEGGEEIYFRHVTAVNQTDGSIELTLGRGQKTKRIETGSDSQSGALIEQLRFRLRTSQAANTPEPPIQFDPELPPPPAPLVALPTSAISSERYCYLRIDKLREYYADPVVIDALMFQLEVPGTAATHKAMTIQQKQAAIEAQADHFSRTPTSFWHRIPRQEILAASLWRCRGDILSERVVMDRFYEVAREEDLRRPVGRWLIDRGDEPYMEIQLGRRRIDALGYNKGTQQANSSRTQEQRRGVPARTRPNGQLYRVRPDCVPCMHPSIRRRLPRT